MIQQIVSIFIQWFIVPLIILSVFGFASTIVAKAPHGEIKTSANSGFWAGMILFVMYIVSQIGNLGLPHISLTLPILELDPLGFGLLIGLSLLGLLRYAVSTRFIGLMSLLLVAVSASSLFQYIFFDDIRSLMLSFTLGSAFGALLHVAIFPKSIQVFWE